MTKKKKPVKPHPSCVWSEAHGCWLWPDDRDAAQRAADEVAARASQSGCWAKLGFLRRHRARVDAPAAPPAKPRARRRGAKKSA